MKLLKLVLNNYQGIKDLNIETYGRSLSVYGDNETGKTTVYNSITWLLFGKSSTGAKNYTPQTMGPDGPLHNLDHSAEGQFQLADGRIITLKKVFHEVWKKKKGSAVEENTGCTIDYYMNGLPVKEKEYTDTVTGYCGDIEKMKMLTIPNYFPENMKMDDRRKILLEICGDVSDNDIIKGTKDLKKLQEYLLIPGTKDQYYNVDEYQRIAKGKESKINDELKKIPARIDEAQKAIPDGIEGLDKAVIEDRLKDLAGRKEKLLAEKAQVMAGDDKIAIIRKKKANINMELQEARSEHFKRSSEANGSTYKAIDELNKKLIPIKSQMQDALLEADRFKLNAERFTQRRQQLIERYTEYQAKQWDEGQAICPTCHRQLPEEDIQKLREEFNLNKANDLEKINKDGQAVSKDKIAELEKQSADKVAEVKTLQADINNIKQQLVDLQGQIKQQTPFEDTDKCKKLMDELQKAEKSENNLDDVVMDQLKGYKDKIAELDTEIHDYESKRAQLEAADTQQARIADLEADEKQYTRQYEALEQGLYLCELFMRTKAQMLTEKINSKFKSVRFRLFQEQYNGGIKEDCEAMVPNGLGRMVPYSYANNAARINAGLEIIDTLSKHWNLILPVCIDNAESVTRLNHIDTQVIRLVVSEPDKKLRLELETMQSEAEEDSAIVA
jgi:DNA repair exonuclease SbcCD ATPase subunit